MKTKSLLLSLVLLALGASLSAQTLTPAGSSTGSITVNAANCNTTNACIILHLASSNVGYSVTASGTWTGTLTVEQSGDNQGSWTSATTTTANTLYTSALTPGITDVRVRGSAAMTGTAVVTITASGPATLQQITQTGGSSSSSLSPAPIMGYYLSNACATGTIGTNGLCFNTPANTQMSNRCTYTSASATVTCQTQMFQTTAAVLSNVATYTFPANVVASWAIGNSITVTAFVGGDTFFNQTCTLTAVAATSVSCALVHANASSTAGFTGTVTNTSAGPFTAFDAGTGNPNGAKRIYGYATCQADNGNISGSSNNPMVTAVTTIAAFVSSLQVTISGTALNSPAANTACVIWGNTDDAGAAAMDLAMLSATQCPRAHLAAGYYMYTVPHHYNNPNACASLPSQIPTGANAGNLIYAAGFELDGRGAGTTVINLTPSFPETGSCTNGLSKKGCFVVPLEGHFSNFMINGGGNFISANYTGSTNLMEIDGPGTLEYYTCTNFGSGSNGTVGLALYLWAQIRYINLAACGDMSLATSSATISATAFQVSIENPRTRAFDLGTLTDYTSQNVAQFNRYNFICYDCYALTQGLSGGSMALMRISNGLSVKLYNYRASKYFGGLNINTIVGLQILGSGGNIDIQDSYFDMTAGGTSTSTGDIGINDQAGANIHIENSIIKGTTSGNGYTGVAGSKLYDMGGNIWGTISSAGSVNADGHSVKGICTGVGTAASTLGLYNTGPNVTATTCTSAAIGTGTAVSGARTLQNLIVSATAAGSVPGSGVVTVLVDGAASTITCTIGTGTTCSDLTHTVALTDGQRVSIQFTTQAADTLAGVKAFVHWN